jgi:hypothetical protein
VGQMTTRTAIYPDRCTAIAKSTGEQCKRRPHPGTTKCVKHGSGAPQVRAAAKRRLALGQATAELDRLGIPVEVDPSEAMLAMVHEAAGNVAFLRMRVAELEQGGRLTGNHDSDDVVSAIAEVPTSVETFCVSVLVKVGIRKSGGAMRRPRRYAMKARTEWSSSCQ